MTVQNAAGQELHAWHYQLYFWVIAFVSLHALVKLPVGIFNSQPIL